MVQTCTKCSRANPSDAVYCYYDGMVLNGQGRAGGPVAVSLQPFASPFVFPSGKACRNFNELALACQDDWTAAKDLLQQGFLGSFLGGLGRIDLAMAAKQAAAFPDRDRGLDELLGKLPADVLQPPKLSLETQELNLGLTPFGTQRKLDLKMENLGGRLLYGTMTCPDGWLSFGDQPGVSQKTFQFTHDLTLPIKIVGDRLRTSNKPIETQIVIDSSGGTKTIIVRAEVPVKVFPAGGVLSGAESPRNVAEKAKAKPKEAAVLFERGDVRAWYKDNGWTYPVQGRDSSGLGAVQQFFEALGLTPAPKVAVNPKSITLSGNAGQTLEQVIEIKTEEKRPVYASGNCEEDWLEVGKAKLKGPVASLPLTIRIPNQPGHSLKTKLTVLSNGNQKFTIPVTLQVGGKFVPTAPVPALPVSVPVAARAVPVAPAVAALPVSAAAVPAMPVSASASPFEDDLSALGASPSEPMVSSRGGSRRGRRGDADVATSAFMHLIPAGLLLMAVLVVVVIDLVKKPASAETASNGDLKGDPTKRPEKPPEKPDEGTGTIPPKDQVVEVAGDPKDSRKWKFAKLKDPEPKLDVAFNDDNRWGLSMRGVKNPRPGQEEKFKQLTFWPNGDSNNTIIKIDGFEEYFGRETKQNKWVDEKDADGKTIKRRGRYKQQLPNGRWGMLSEMDFTYHQIRVTQHVEVVPSKEGLLDTCLIYYTIKNYGTAAHAVGIRVMVDTFIGSNDGVPFTIPGERGFLTTMKEFPQKDIPEYIEAIENPDDVKDLGTVARMTLKGLRLPGVQLEDILHLVICRWPDPPGKDVRWQIPIEPIDKNPENKDSCVVLYWAYLPMNPDEERRMAFTYGLSKLDVVAEASDGPMPMKSDSPMALRVPDASQLPGAEFYVTAYVWNSKPGQKVKLVFPKGGLELATNEQEERTLTGGTKERVQISWKVKAGGTKGTYEVQAVSGETKTKPRTVDVQPVEKKPTGTTSIFG